MLESNAKTAWEYLSQPKLILEEVLKSRNLNYSDAELIEISLALKPSVYETQESVFNTALDKLLDNISYNRNTKLLQELWFEKTNTSLVSEWCNEANVPIKWIVEEPTLTAIETVKSIQDKKKVSNDVLQGSVDALKNNNLTVLKDEQHILDRFFAYIGENYRRAFLADKEIILARLKTDARLTSDVYSWSNKVPEIRVVLDNYLEKIYKQQAIDRVKSMPETKLREAVIHLLHENPELYSNFLGQEDV